MEVCICVVAGFRCGVYIKLYQTGGRGLHCKYDCKDISRLPTRKESRWEDCDFLQYRWTETTYEKEESAPGMMENLEKCLATTADAMGKSCGVYDMSGLAP